MLNKRGNKSRFYNNFLIVLGIVCILYCIFGLSLGWGFYFGLKIIVSFGVLILFHALLRSRSERYRKSSISKLFNIGITVCLLFSILFEGLIFSGAHFNNSENSEYLLVLGAGIINDQPTLELKYRLDKAIEFINDDDGLKKVVLCGGKGRDEKYSEAYVMEQYLLKHGVMKKKIIKEEKSSSTYENIKYAKDAISNIDSRENIKVVISSNDFHLFRAKLIAERLGFEAVGLPSKTPLYIIPNHHVREYFAITKTFVFD